MIARNANIAPATPANPFSIGRVWLCLLPLLVLALWILALSGFATAGGRATAESPARLSVSIPASAKSANIAMLELSISVVRKPKSGQLGAVVRLGGSEIGRVSIASGSQSYQFNVTQALGPASGGSATVEVELIDRGGGSAPPDAELSIGSPRVVTR
jgi:hypothetical protein